MLSGFSSSTLTVMLISGRTNSFRTDSWGFLVGLDGCQDLSARGAIFRARDRQINSPSSISPAVVHHHVGLLGTTISYSSWSFLLSHFSVFCFSRFNTPPSFSPKIFFPCLLCDFPPIFSRSHQRLSRRLAQNNTTQSSAIITLQGW